MKNIFLGIVCLLSISLYSQNNKFEKPEYKKIEKEIQKKSSTFYYPLLLERFHQADTTLSLEEKRHLYYGFQFHKDYNPYEIYLDNLQVVRNTPELKTDDLEKINNYADSILVKDPFNLRILNYKMYSCDKLQKEEEIHKTLVQIQTIIGAIMSTGNGLNKENPFYVIRVSDEYEMLNILDFEFSGDQKLIESLDYLSIKENPYKIKGLYFDISANFNFKGNSFN